jgi:hypothetical protein
MYQSRDQGRLYSILDNFIQKQPKIIKIFQKISSLQNSMIKRAQAPSKTKLELP